MAGYLFQMKVLRDDSYVNLYPTVLAENIIIEEKENAGDEKDKNIRHEKGTENGVR